MRTQPAHSLLVFCDLDQSLLDPLSHDVDAAGRASLDRLTRRRVPIVFWSDKTRAELEVIQYKLGTYHPFICERGAAVFVPRGYFGVAVPQARDVAGYEVVEFGRSYADVVTTLHRSADRLGIAVRGFSDMSVKDVATECGMPLLQARLAKLREYSELFRVVETERGASPRLLKALRAAGLHCTSRGLHHYAGTGRRDIAAQFLCRLYQRAFGDVETIAFDDPSLC
jgi:mannosyl-3-phosphoglycerate phosphatase